MPRSYVPRIRVRQPHAPLGAVSARSNAPYRAHQPNGFEAGIAHAAEALFRAPQERASIEASREANQQARDYQKSRDDKNDLFREHQLELEHQDRQDAITERRTTRTKEGASKSQTGVKMSPLPAFVTERDPDTGKVTGQRPLNRNEVNDALTNRGYVDAYNKISAGGNEPKPATFNQKPGVASLSPFAGTGQAFQATAGPDELFQQAAIADHGVAPAGASPAPTLFGAGDVAAGQQFVAGQPTPESQGVPVENEGSLPEMPPEIANFHEHVTGQDATPDDHAKLDQIMPKVLGIVAKMHPHDQDAFRAMMANASADYQSGDKARAAAAMQRVQGAMEQLGVYNTGQTTGAASLTPAFSAPGGTAPAEPDLFGGGE